MSKITIHTDEGMQNKLI